MELQSQAFAENEPIPMRYTCDGENVHPPLTLVAVPSNVRSLALIVYDPDAPTGDFTHWIVWNIPPDTAEITEDALPPGTVEGLTDFGKSGYGGPCPPSGSHRYYFELYALDVAELPLEASATRSELEAAMNGHIIEQAALMGTYQRQA